ncbi:MAG: hypothetical protein DRJ64_01540 [Thermoprotei archaeon]|nr:MAG: hypothetical protein DRJ64_01540 [Thermoprotei archaeon]
MPIPQATAEAFLDALIKGKRYPLTWYEGGFRQAALYPLLEDESFAGEFVRTLLNSPQIPRKTRQLLIRRLVKEIKQLADARKISLSSPDAFLEDVRELIEEKHGAFGKAQQIITRIQIRRPSLAKVVQVLRGGQDVPAKWMERAFSKYVIPSLARRDTLGGELASFLLSKNVSAASRREILRKLVNDIADAVRSGKISVDSTAAFVDSLDEYLSEGKSPVAKSLVDYMNRTVMTKSRLLKVIRQAKVNRIIRDWLRHRLPKSVLKEISLQETADILHKAFVHSIAIEPKGSPLFRLFSAKALEGEELRPQAARPLWRAFDIIYGKSPQQIMQRINQLKSRFGAALSLEEIEQAPMREPPKSQPKAPPSGAAAGAAEAAEETGWKAKAVAAAKGAKKEAEGFWSTLRKSKFYQWAKRHPTAAKGLGGLALLALLASEFIPEALNLAVIQPIASKAAAEQQSLQVAAQFLPEHLRTLRQREALARQQEATAFQLLAQAVAQSGLTAPLEGLENLGEEDIPFRHM